MAGLAPHRCASSFGMGGLWAIHVHFSGFVALAKNDGEGKTLAFSCSYISKQQMSLHWAW